MLTSTPLAEGFPYKLILFNFFFFSYELIKGGILSVIDVEFFPITIGSLGICPAQGHVPSYNYLKGETVELEISGLI